MTSWSEMRERGGRWVGGVEERSEEVQREREEEKQIEKKNARMVGRPEWVAQLGARCACWCTCGKC